MKKTLLTLITIGTLTGCTQPKLPFTEYTTFKGNIYNWCVDSITKRHGYADLEFCECISTQVSMNITKSEYDLFMSKTVSDETKDNALSVIILRDGVKCVKGETK